MDTRVLTLFDDEDFFPKEEPKKKPKKETPVKETESEGTAPISYEQDHQSTETIHEETIVPEVTHAAVMPDTPIPPPPAEKSHPENKHTGETEYEIPESVPNAAITVDDKNEDEVASDDAEQETSDTEVEAEATAADEDELNKQILSELIQVDYASLIHRDYPFDVSHAAIVSKSKAVVVNEPVSEPGSTEDDVFEDIVPLPEWKLDKKYYTIGEVAQLFSVNTSHIRFWTNEFKLKPRTTRKGDRLYSPKDIAELRLIHHLVKEKKHTIKGAKEKLKADKNDVNNKLDLKDSLISLRDTLLQIKAQL